MFWPAQEVILPIDHDYVLGLEEAHGYFYLSGFLPFWVSKQRPPSNPLMVTPLTQAIISLGGTVALSAD